MNISLNDLDVDESKNPRKSPDPSLRFLIQSIKDKGLLMPVLVRRTNDKYRLISGYRRVAAIKEIARENNDVNAKIFVRVLRDDEPDPSLNDLK